MKFAKGMAIGALITAGAMMIYSEGIDNSKRKVLKKGKQIIRKMR